MKGFTEPNYTQTPNALFDECMKVMGDAELRVTLAVIRKTMGFHKTKDAISYSQIHQMTGLSRSSIQSGIELAIEHGYIRRVGTGKRKINIFELVVNVDQSTSTTSTSSVALPVTSSVALLTKEKEKKSTKENTLDAGKPRRELDPEFELIADIWHTRAGGYVANMKGMIFGTRKVKGEWLKCQFDPPATVEELTAFKPYMQSRIAEKRMTEPPTAAVTIQRWFYDFRAMREKQLTPVSPPVFDLSDWYIPELEPLK